MEVRCAGRDKMAEDVKDTLADREVVALRGGVGKGRERQGMSEDWRANRQ